MLMKMNLLIYLIKEKFLRSNKPNLKLVDKKKLIVSSKINKSKKNKLSWTGRSGLKIGGIESEKYPREIKI